MADEKPSLDLLGMKGISDSIKIVTEGTMDGASAFLSRVCLPALEEFGLALRDRVSAWRAKNASSVFNQANELMNELQPGTNATIHPRLVHVAFEGASWADIDYVQKIWAGLLVSGTSPDGTSDENLIFMNILSQLSALQVRIICTAVERAEKYNAGSNLPMADPLILTVDELAHTVDCSDIQRLDRELDHLRETGLIGGAFGGGIMAGKQEVDIMPTALALHLFVRAQGTKDSPVVYWGLTQKDGESN